MLPLTESRIIGAFFVILAVISAIGFYPAAEVISYKQEESDLPTIPQVVPTKISVRLPNVDQIDSIVVGSSVIDNILYQVSVNALVAAVGNRTGIRPTIVPDTDATLMGKIISIGQPKVNLFTASLIDMNELALPEDWSPESFAAVSLLRAGAEILLIMGYDSLGDAYGAFWLAEQIETGSEIGATDLFAIDTTRVPEAKIRLIDAGGVFYREDVPPSRELNWGDVMWIAQMDTDEDPFIDTMHFASSATKFKTYCKDILRMGFNGITIGHLLLHLVNFDLIGDGYEVYPADSKFRIRHENYVERFGQLFEYAQEMNIGIYIGLDTFPLTQPLEEYLTKKIGGLDTSNEFLWQVYKKAIEELFLKLPSVRGIIIRIGEAGGAYVLPEYYSKLAIDDVPKARKLLTEFIPLVESFNKTLIFRTWTIGAGKIGDLHIEPSTYHQVFDGIYSPNLVVSIKYCRGDYYRYLPFNPTIGVDTEGNKIMVEFQATPEYEGRSLYPNFLGELHKEAMKYAFREKGAVGIMVVSQGGGWGVGPFSLYRFRGFWRFTDANVYVTSRLAWNCSIDLVNATKAWVIRTFGSNEEVVANLTRLLLLSDGAIEKGLYIRDYARYEFQVFGKWVPPMLWIWWWDVAGSPGIFSLIYRSCARNLNQNVEEGFEAVTIVENMIQLANGLNVSTNLHDFEMLQESLLYEKMLFETLAWYRATFLYYLRWAETLDSTYERLFREALAAFEEKHQSYLSRYDGSSDIFVPYNMDEALTYIQRLKNGPVSTHLSRVGLIVVLGLLAMAVPFIQSRVPKILRKRPIRRAYATLFHAFRLGRDLKQDSATATDGLFILLLFVIVSSISIVVLDGFIHTVQILLLTFALGLGVWMLLTGVIFFAGRRQGASVAFSNLMGMSCYLFVPLLAPSLIVLATSSISTPHLFWHGFWIELWFRYGVFLSTFISLLWASMVLFLITRRALELPVRTSLGVLLTIFGFLMFSAVTAVLFIGADNLLFILIQALSLFPTAAFYSGAGAPTILGIRNELLLIPASMFAIILVVGLALVMWRPRREFDNPA